MSAHPTPIVGAPAVRSAGSAAAEPVTMANVIAALPDAGMAATFLMTWLVPMQVGPRAVRYLLLVMLLEFVIVHSAAFMGHVILSADHRWQKINRVVALGAFYSLFVVGFAASFHVWWPITAFWLLTLNRLLPVVLGAAPVGAEREMARRGWAAAATFYLGFACLTIFAPLPAFGITRDVIAGQELTVGGLWTREPQRALAFGLLYFGAMAISELYGHRWARGARWEVSRD